MKIRNILGLAAIGGLAYAHKKHGGEWTLDSIKQSFQDLMSGVKTKANQVRDEARETLDRGASTASSTEGLGSAYGGTGYGTR